MKIFDYEEVVMNWDSFTYPIAVGTPVSVDGVLADNSSAHGLIARTVFAKPDGGDTLKIMTGGFIDMEEIVAGYGQELSSAAVQALCGIHFYKEGVCIPTGGSGGGDDSQKWKTETSTQLFSETVTTAIGDYPVPSASITFEGDDPDGMIKAVFDGVTYELSPDTGYGAPYVPETDSFDFSVYPFALEFDEGSCFLLTETSGEHTISVSTKSTTYTDAFKEGVAKNSTFYVDFDAILDIGITANKTFDEIVSAYNNGAVVLGRFNARIYNIARVVIEDGSIKGIGFSYVEYVPDAEKVDVKLIRADNEGFTYYAKSISTAVVTP